MNAWEVVDIEEWMNILDSTWAFKVKRNPAGEIKKLKARFCARGDQQLEGIDFFETYAPVINWHTVRIMLVLSILFELQTMQVDYTAAFIHAPIDRPPNYDQMSKEEQRKVGVYVRMPRGYTKPGKVLKLNRSLYGLKQSPRNYFLYMKDKLEAMDLSKVSMTLVFSSLIK